VTMNSTWHSIAPRVIEVGLFLLAGWWAFSMFQSNPDTEQSPVSTIEGGIEKETLVSIKALTAVPLFGKVNVPIVVKKPVSVPKPVVVSRLKIKLLGTIVAGDRSAAMMTVGTSAETLFNLGDPLYGRVTLKAVEADAVILNHQGSDERISMSEGKSIAEARIGIPHKVVSQGIRPNVHRRVIPPPGVPTYPQGLPPGVPAYPQGLPPGVTVGQPPM